MANKWTLQSRVGLLWEQYWSIEYKWNHEDVKKDNPLSNFLFVWLYVIPPPRECLSVCMFVRVFAQPSVHPSVYLLYVSVHMSVFVSVQISPVFSSIASCWTMLTWKFSHWYLSHLFIFQLCIMLMTCCHGHYYIDNCHICLFSRFVSYRSNVDIKIITFITVIFICFSAPAVSGKRSYTMPTATHCQQSNTTASASSKQPYTKTASASITRRFL